MSIRGDGKLLLTKSYLIWHSCALCMSLYLMILFPLNSGDECSLYLVLLMQRMVFVCEISSLLIHFLYEFPQSRQVRMHQTVINNTQMSSS